MTEDSNFDFQRPHPRRSMVLLAAGALIGLVLAGFGLFTAKGTRSRGVPAEAIALVNQRPILRSDFAAQAQTQFAIPFEQTSAEQRRKTLNDMIDEELMMQRGLEMDLPSFDPEVRAALVAGVELEVTADVLAQQPAEQSLRAFYEAHKERYSTEGVLRLRDLVPSAPGSGSRAALDVAVAALRAGISVDIAMKQYALKDSGLFMDAGHVDTGEIFDFAVRAKADPGVYAAIHRMAAGEVSAALKAGDGWHIVLVIAHRFPIAQSYEQAANRVWSDFNNAAQLKVRAGNLRYLRQRADISVAADLAP